MAELSHISGFRCIAPGFTVSQLQQSGHTIARKKSKRKQLENVVFEIEWFGLNFKDNCTFLIESL